MKKYLKFVKEDLQTVKDEIADSVANDEDNNKEETIKKEEEINQKSNKEIEITIEDYVKKLEDKKTIINKQIEVYTDQIALTEDPEIVKGLEERVQKLEADLLQFDDMLKNSTEQVSKLQEK